MAIHKKYLSLIFILVGTLLCTGLSKGAESISETFSISINPSENLQDKKPKLVYELRPSEEKEDLVTIRNFSDQKVKIKIYSVDSKQSSDGSVAFKLSEEKQTNIGNWIKFQSISTEIEAGKSIYVPYNIAIPDQIPPGSYQGAIVVEMIKEDLSKNQIQIKTRVVEPIYIVIPGRKETKFDLSEFSYQISDGQPAFYLRLNNKGNTILQGNATIKITGSMLSKPLEMSLNHPTILPGEVFEKLITLNNPPLLGEYKASLNFQINELDLNQDRLIEIETINRSVNFQIIPWNCLIALVFIILLIIILERLRRKYLQEKISSNFIHIVKAKENITQIARTYDLKWQTIVKLNKLHKPYNLKPGQELKLPFPKSKKK